MDARPLPTSLYEAHLRGAPELCCARRTELEVPARRDRDARFGGHTAAAGALHALVDPPDPDTRKVSWNDAMRAAVDQLWVLLSLGARCEWKLTAEAKESRVT